MGYCGDCCLLQSPGFSYAYLLQGGFETGNHVAQKFALFLHHYRLGTRGEHMHTPRIDI